MLDDKIVSSVTFPSFLLLLKAAVPALTPPLHTQPGVAPDIIAATTSGFPLLAAVEAAALFNFVDAPAGFDGIVVE